MNQPDDKQIIRELLAKVADLQAKNKVLRKQFKAEKERRLALLESVTR